jgi:hypothetical protein
LDLSGFKGELVLSLLLIDGSIFNNVAHASQHAHGRLGSVNNSLTLSDNLDQVLLDVFICLCNLSDGLLAHSAENSHAWTLEKVKVG